MLIKKCHFVLSDFLFYATREMGRLYETEKYIHNYALTYALGFIKKPYFSPDSVPTYEKDFIKINKGIYVTPARPVYYNYAIHTFKFGEEDYHTTSKQLSKNEPSPSVYGRIKELTPESKFEFFIFSQENIKIPKWIRLKWMCKARVEIINEFQNPKIQTGKFIVNHPLNPLDLNQKLITCDIIAMPPVSLINNAEMEGEYYSLDGINFPANMEYGFKTKYSSNKNRNKKSSGQKALFN